MGGVMKIEQKFYAKKRTKSGRYIVVAEGNTRKELIDSLKRDSETFDNNSRESKEREDGKEIHGYE
jgi:hypothetical protein